MTAAAVPEGPPAGRTTPATVRAASSLLAALAAPMRLAIVASLLEHGSRCVHQLVDEVGGPQPLVSQHLRVLRSAGLVLSERRHREVHYTLVDPHVGHIVRGALEHVSHPSGEAGPVAVRDDGPGCPVDEGTRTR